MSRPIRTLLFSTLYPSSSRPGHGLFVETRLRELLKDCDVETRVVAPVPWFYSTEPRHGIRAAMARTPRREVRNGIDVRHPRYLVVPKIGMTIAPLLLALGARSAVRQVISEGFDFDLIDAHYYYPDGVAAALLAAWFDKPFVVTARGTDLNLIARFALPGAMIRWAARRAAGSIGVSSSLLEPLRRKGLDPSSLHVMRNGVDLTRFAPLEPAAMRRRLAIQGRPVLLSVGNLLPVKGHHLVIEAVARLREKHHGIILLIVGEGPERDALSRLVDRLELREHVRLAGAVPNEELSCWYSAADALVLASSREGWANVLLEAMACGTPVVASPVGGTPEVLGRGSGGRLVSELSSEAIAKEIDDLLQSRPDRVKVRRYAEGFDWRPTSLAQRALFEAILAGSRGTG